MGRRVGWDLAGDMPERESDPRVRSGGGISGLVMEGFRGSEILLGWDIGRGLRTSSLHRSKKRVKCKGRNLVVPIVQGQK